MTEEDGGRGKSETAAAALGETLSEREAAVLERIEAFRRRRPRFRDDFVTLAHGAGGKASAALIDAVFLDAFRGLERPPLTDAALIALPHGETLAFTTDSFVVKPLRFPGGSIGHLAVHGTVNDLAVMGAHPHWLSAAFVIEEGFAISELRKVVADMSEAAAVAGVTIVTGDTKVVGRGAADGLYVTTAGIGVIPPGRRLGADLVERGDRVLISGTIADHGMAVMLARGDLALEAELKSDTAPVTGLVEALFSAAPSTRWLRDRGACEILGFDPLYVANEGKLLAVVAAKEADAAVEALRRHPLGSDAVLIGDIRAEPQGIVVLRTSFGGTRIVDMLVGDPLPRIC